MRFKIASMLKYLIAIGTFQVIYYITTAILPTDREGDEPHDMVLRNGVPQESFNKMEYQRTLASQQKEEIERDANPFKKVIEMRREVQKEKAEVQKEKAEVQKEKAEKSTILVEDVMRIRRERFERNAKAEDTIEPPGMRKPTVNLTEDEERRAKEAIEQVGYNIVLNDKVPLERPLGDLRADKCRSMEYAADLPTASVIITFYNEHWRTLLRAVHSVVNRSPPEYLHEVILVDDASTHDDIRVDLQKYIEETWPDGIVHLVHKPQRDGVVGARIHGGDVATGDVIVFVDAQCEVSRGWLEPLLARIKFDRTIIATPQLDNIKAETLAYNGRPKHAAMVGSFSWTLGFRWSSPQSNEVPRRKSELDPARSPTLIGCAIAVERRFFYEIGKFDDKMTGWGGEDVELALRTWMCGGSVEVVPCSRVGHTFKQSKIDIDQAFINVHRIAHVWLDDYFEIFERIVRPHPTTGLNVTERVQLRQKLGCKSFKWYLENVAPDKIIPNKDVYGWGKIRQSERCLHTIGRSRTNQLGFHQCQTNRTTLDQYTKEIKNLMTRKCLDTRKHTVTLIECDHSVHQQWEIETMLRDPPPLCVRT